MSTSKNKRKERFAPGQIWCTWLPGYGYGCVRILDMQKERGTQELLGFICAYVGSDLPKLDDPELFRAMDDPECFGAKRETDHQWYLTGEFKMMELVGVVPLTEAELAICKRQFLNHKILFKATIARLAYGLTFEQTEDFVQSQRDLADAPRVPGLPAEKLAEIRRRRDAMELAPRLRQVRTRPRPQKPKQAPTTQIQQTLKRSDFTAFWKLVDLIESDGDLKRYTARIMRSFAKNLERYYRVYCHLMFNIDGPRFAEALGCLRDGELTSSDGFYMERCDVVFAGQQTYNAFLLNPEPPTICANGEEAAGILKSHLDALEIYPTDVHDYESKSNHKLWESLN